MNIKEIGLIANHPNISDELKRTYIISLLASDKQVIPDILEILASERKNSEELILDQNFELSRSLIVLQSKHLKWSKNIVAEPSWVSGEIVKHYKKWKDRIKCNFKIKGLE